MTETLKSFRSPRSQSRFLLNETFGGMTSCHPLILLLLTFALFGLSAPARSTAGANGKDAAVRGGRGTIDHYFAPKLDDDDDVQTATPTDDDDAA